MNAPKTTALRPSFDLDATDELPVLDVAAYEAEVLSREPAGPAGSVVTATESDASAAGSLAPDHLVANAAPPVVDSDDMLAVEHWIVQKTEELRAHHLALSLAQRERTAAVARADALSRELAETSANLEALNGRERTLEEALTSEREAAQRRAAELDAARCEAARIAQELAGARAAGTQQSAALAASAALLEQRSGDLEALQRTHEALLTDRQRAAGQLSELETRLRDSEARERNAQRTIEAQRHAHAELTQHVRHETCARECLAAEVDVLKARLAACLESLQSRESYRAIYESALQQRDAELAAERGESERARSALESRLAESTAEGADACARLLAMEATLAVAQRRAEAEALASGTAAQRLRELESAMASRQADLTQAQLEIERNRESLSDLTAAMVQSQRVLADQSRLLEEREAAARAMAATHAEQTGLITSLRGQVEELTARLATPEAERRALEERVTALTKQVAESDSRLARLESMNAELRATTEQLHASLGERDADLQRATRIASMNAHALGRVRSSLDEASRSLTASDDAPAQGQASILTRIDGGQNHSVVLRGRTTIGRDTDNDLRVPIGSVSRHHAVLIPAFRSALVQDLSSTNGVLVNHRRVRCARLEHGDVINLGKAQFRYTVAPAPPDPVSAGSNASTSTRALLNHAP